MKAMETEVYIFPVSIFRREIFKLYLANIGIDSKHVYPSLDTDPLESANDITGYFKYPFVIYHFNLSHYTEAKRSEFRRMLNTF